LKSTTIYKDIHVSIKTNENDLKSRKEFVHFLKNNLNFKEKTRQSIKF
jgi:hypothetical protein